MSRSNCWICYDALKRSLSVGRQSAQKVPREPVDNGSVGRREAGAAGRPDRARSRPAKKTFNEEREHAALPARIEQLEGEQRLLRAEADAADFYKAGGELYRPGQSPAQTGDKARAFVAALQAARAATPRQAL